MRKLSLRVSVDLTWPPIPGPPGHAQPHTVVVATTSRTRLVCLFAPVRLYNNTEISAVHATRRGMPQALSQQKQAPRWCLDVRASLAHSLFQACIYEAPVEAF